MVVLKPKPFIICFITTWIVFAIFLLYESIPIVKSHLEEPSIQELNEEEMNVVSREMIQEEDEDEEEISEDLIERYHLKHAKPCHIQNQIKFYGSIEQDRRIFETFFQNPLWCDGVVVEVGAGDGMNSSNSKFFEESLHWKSFNFEPNMELYLKLQENRPNSHNFPYAINGKSGFTEFVEAGELGGILSLVNETQLLNDIFFGNVSQMQQKIVQVPSFTLFDALERYQIEEIDLLSLDLGGKESSILNSIDFNYWIIKLIILQVIESNPESQKSQNILINQGFLLIDKFQDEEVYINSKLIQEQF